MRSKYVNINDTIYHEIPFMRTHNTYILDLPNDFIQSKNDKYIIVKKFRMFNGNGQMDIGACLTSEILSKECCYNFGINYNQNYIMSANELNDKKFKISSDIKQIDFTFTDYKGEKINITQDLSTIYYYVLELELLY